MRNAYHNVDDSTSSRIRFCSASSGSMRNLILICLAGCWTTGSLESSALHNEKKAQVQAELGNGAAAAHASHRAVSEQEAAQRKAEADVGWWHTEVLMR